MFQVRKFEEKIQLRFEIENYKHFQESKGKVFINKFNKNILKNANRT